jgi:hypothetical protein
MVYVNNGIVKQNILEQNTFLAKFIIDTCLVILANIC